MLLVYEQVERMVNTQWTPDSPVMVSLKTMLTTLKLICGGSGREKPSWSWTTRHDSWRNQHQRSDSWRHSGTQSGWLWESGLKISRDSRPLRKNKQTSRLVFRVRALIQVFWSSSAGEVSSSYLRKLSIFKEWTSGSKGSLDPWGSSDQVSHCSTSYVEKISSYVTVSDVVKM